MFGRDKSPSVEATPPPVAASAPPPPAAVAKIIPPPPPPGESVIASKTFMRGSLTVERKLRIEGHFEGKLLTKGDITPAMFRDRFGTTRKYAIPLLEYLDREGVTVRMGEARRVRNPTI